MPRLVPTVRTPVTRDAYVRAVVTAWPNACQRAEREGAALSVLNALPSEPTKRTAGLLYGQYVQETGGVHVYGFNLGNVKHRDGDGCDWQALRGVWEGVSKSEAERLIQTGQARLDDSLDHARAVGENAVSVVFEPPHPATFFRVFPSLASAMEEHLVFLMRRYPSAMLALVDVGSTPDGVARALKAGGYFTADASAYAVGIAHGLSEVLTSGPGAYELALADVRNERPASSRVFARAAGSFPKTVLVTAVVAGLGTSFFHLTRSPRKGSSWAKRSA